MSNRYERTIFFTAIHRICDWWILHAKTFKKRLTFITANAGFTHIEHNPFVVFIPKMVGLTAPKVEPSNLFCR